MTKDLKNTRPWAMRSNVMQHSMKLLSPYLLIAAGVALIVISFFLPSEFNDLIRQHPEIFSLDYIGFIGFYSLLLIPITVIFIFLKKFEISLWLSFAFLTAQVFVVAFMMLLSQEWYVYVINLAGIILTFFAIKVSFLGTWKKYSVVIGLAIVYFLLLTLNVLLSGTDRLYSLIWFVLFGSYLIRITINVRSKFIYLIINALYIIAIFFWIHNLRCNIEFIGDIGYQNWSISNLYSRCNTYFLWIVSAILFNVASLLFYKNATLHNKRASSQPGKRRVDSR